MRNFIFLTLLLLFAVPVNSQIYKWVDRNGKVQYSDQPPPLGVSKNEKMLDIQSSPQPVNEGESITKDLMEKKQEFKERRAAREEARNKQLAEAEMRKENCLRAQSNLDLLKNSERLSVADGNGGVIDADDQLRQSYMNEALKNIATYCQ
ncbi:DUF4124 domain-containing protein [Nitrosomonas sp. Nm33]|uniref:DUF4124 domain-containing protein n=1 Tax=Nitrosomonas sp. Nm33 TaxID=133724 RepID=UPI00089B8142|nr:DUF4124 domain-containing protein [Nitrosomonas sp. Nm33]SDY12443.1 protein of unknown function [Nitrosomonas sp. Nm33]